LRTPGLKCAVERCQEDAKREGLCVVHALTWLLSRESAPTSGRDERLASFVKRQDNRAALRGMERR
jgi:hypothetical protein